MSFCSKCHYGSDVLRIDKIEEWRCPNCGNIGAIETNPFNSIKNKKTLRDTRKDRQLEMEAHGEKNDGNFTFNEKDIMNPVNIRMSSSPIR
jgi:hypothetical protein